MSTTSELTIEYIKNMPYLSSLIYCHTSLLKHPHICMLARGLPWGVHSMIALQPALAYACQNCLQPLASSSCSSAVAISTVGRPHKRFAQFPHRRDLCALACGCMASETRERHSASSAIRRTHTTVAQRQEAAVSDSEMPVKGLRLSSDRLLTACQRARVLTMFQDSG